MLIDPKTEVVPLYYQSGHVGLWESFQRRDMYDANVQLIGDAEFRRKKPLWVVNRNSFMYQTFQALIPVEPNTAVGRFHLLDKNTRRVDLYRVTEVRGLQAELQLLESCECNDEDHGWFPQYPTRCSREFVIAGLKKVTDPKPSGPVWVVDAVSAQPFHV